MPGPASVPSKFNSFHLNQTWLAKGNFMDVQQAAERAKIYIADLLQSEQLVNIGLEEVEFDEARDEWVVTIGFSRQWDMQARNALLASLQSANRTYKVLRIRDSDQRVLSMKNRETLRNV